MKIYAIDDEELMLEALIEAIDEALPQAEVTGFQMVGPLLEAFKHEPRGIVFIDIELPGMDGIMLAQKLQEIKADVNIIFVTGYEEYKGDAMDIYASAYILKPVTPEGISDAIQHLRYTVHEQKHHFRAITFGNFSLYVDGKPVVFHRKKSVELLAYLVARGGTLVRRAELTLILFEDAKHTINSRKYLDNAIYTLWKDLKAVGAEKLLHRGSDGLSVNREILEADIFDYLDGKNSSYNGQFMEQYTWSESVKGNLDERK